MTDVTGLERAVKEHARLRAVALGEGFVDIARSLAPRRTGELAESIEAGDPVETSTGWSLRVTVAAEYGRFQEEGTGIYGPDGTPIYPTDAKVLVFDWVAAGGIVFAAHVKGTEPTHFWQRTLDRWPDIVAAA